MVSALVIDSKLASWRLEGSALLVPKYQQLLDVLKSDIKRNFECGDKFYSQRELMREHHLSLATVERALSILRSEGIVVRTLGSGTYVASKHERPTVSSDVKTIHMVTRHSENVLSYYFYAGIFDGIMSMLVDNEISVVFSSYDNGHFTKSLEMWGRDGTVFVVDQHEHKQFIAEFEGSGMPIVAVGGYWPDVNFATVCSDSAGGTRQALKYLADHGHRDVALVNVSDPSIDIALRSEVFLESCSEFGLVTNSEWRFDFGTECLQREDMDKLRSVFLARQRPTALFFSALYPIVMPTMAALRSMKIRIPEDCSIIGYDDPDWLSHQTPSITCVRQPLVEMGRLALTKLVCQMEKRPVESQMDVLPVEIVERDSVTQPLLTDWQVSEKVGGR